MTDVCDVVDCENPASVSVVGEAGELWVCAVHALQFGF
jgi:hypothetical protein